MRSARCNALGLARGVRAVTTLLRGRTSNWRNQVAWRGNDGVIWLRAYYPPLMFLRQSLLTGMCCSDSIVARIGQCLAGCWSPWTPWRSTHARSTRALGCLLSTPVAVIPIIIGARRGGHSRPDPNPPCPPLLCAISSCYICSILCI